MMLWRPWSSLSEKGRARVCFDYHEAAYYSPWPCAQGASLIPCLLELTAGCPRPSLTF